MQHVMNGLLSGAECVDREGCRSLAATPNAPRDMLAAGALQTGRQVTEAEVKDNVMTFILGGQETTSSASTSSIRIG